MNRWWGEALTSRRGACTLRLARTLAPPACSWSQCLVERTWNLSMNRRPSGCFGLEDEIVFPGQFLQQILFGLDYFLFVFFEPLFHVGNAMDHEAPEQFGQFAGQRQIGDQAPFSTFEAAIEAAQGFVDTAANTPSNDAKQSPRSIARSSLTAPSPLAALVAARGQPQPRREVFLGFPVLAQVRAD